jgi:hypothetical protein
MSAAAAAIESPSRVWIVAFDEPELGSIATQLFRKYTHACLSYAIAARGSDFLFDRLEGKPNLRVLREVAKELSMTLTLEETEID